MNNLLKERLEKMSGITQKAKSRFHSLKALAVFFSAIKNHKKYKQEQKNVRHTCTEQTRLAVNASFISRRRSVLLMRLLGNT